MVSKKLGIPLMAFAIVSLFFLSSFAQEASAYVRETWDGILGIEWEDGDTITDKSYWGPISYKVDDNKLVLAFSMGGIGDYARYQLVLENPDEIQYENKYGRTTEIKSNSHGRYHSRTTLEIEPGTYNNVKVHLVCYAGECSQDIYSIGTFDFEIEEDMSQPSVPYWCKWWPWHHMCR